MVLSRIRLVSLTFLVGCSGVLPTAAPSPDDPEPRNQAIALDRIAQGLDAAVGISFQPAASIPYIVDQSGRIVVRRDGTLSTFLDIRDRVQYGGERGLLSFVFDPSYATNRRIYAMYTDGQGDLRVSRFVARTDRRSVDPATERIVIDIGHREHSNHNGGQLAFDPDGFLLIGTGDGGGAGGPNGYAQSRASLLGKILRIGVNRDCGGRRYCVPAENPFVVNGRRSEILHLGLRNPWRFWSDASGKVFVGDVGQGEREEVSILRPGWVGKNLGWDCREGTRNTVSDFGGSYCAGKTFLPPAHEYRHTSGRCAIVGGSVVYDGGSLNGSYLFGDYCTGEVFSMRWSGGRWVVGRILDHNANITSFGRDPNGRVYLVDSEGDFYRIVS